jgi:hypothetical protein
MQLGSFAIHVGALSTERAEPFSIAARVKPSM